MKPLTPDMLKYLGHFFLPVGPQVHAPELPPPLRQEAKFGYGGRAMCLSGSDGRHLWISGSKIGDLVAEVEIPAMDGTAMVTRQFEEVMSRAERSAAKLDELVGLAEHEGKRWALWQDWYDVDGVDGGRKSLWDGERLFQVGDGRIKRTSGYLTAHDGSLWCGRSDGAGNPEVHHGPALYRVQHQNGWQKFESFPIPNREDWTPADKYKALAFVEGHVCWLVRKALGSEAEGTVWYGSGPVGPKGHIDEWEKGKGYHAHDRQVWLMPYTWPDLEPLEPIVLVEFHESSRCGGMAYDAERRILYAHEVWPEETMPGVAMKHERPRIHVWQVEVPASEPEPEPEPEERVYRVDYPDGRHGEYADTDSGKLMLIRQVTKVSE